jgi:hypothetical protein
MNPSTISNRSPPGPRSTDATTASSSTGFNAQVLYRKYPPGRVNAAALDAIASCV